MTEKTSELLNRAADEIEKYGWTTGIEGWYKDDRYGSGLCIEGGILAAMGLRWGQVDLEEFHACPAYRAVSDYLGLKREQGEELFEWNDGLHDFADSGAESMEHVIEVLRGAALVEAAKEQAVETVNA